MSVTILSVAPLPTPRWAIVCHAWRNTAGEIETTTEACPAVAIGTVREVEDPRHSWACYLFETDPNDACLETSPAEDNGAWAFLPLGEVADPSGRLAADLVERATEKLLREEEFQRSRQRALDFREAWMARMVNATPAERISADVGTAHLYSVVITDHRAMLNPQYEHRSVTRRNLEGKPGVLEVCRQLFGEQITEVRVA